MSIWPTAPRSVLALLGLDSRGYLEGELTVSQLRERLAGITAEALDIYNLRSDAHFAKTEDERGR